MNEEQHRYSIEGKVCVVTGASAGIGQSLCMHLASSGADLIGVGRNLARLATTKAGVNDIGRRFVAVEADVSKVEDIERAAQEMLTAAPQIHVLVNNAGIGANRSLLEETADGFDRMIAINLRAPFLLARALAPQMIARKSG